MVWAVAQVLAAVNGERGCFPKQATIARMCGYAERTVRAGIRWLKDRGIIAIQRRGPTSAVYTMPEKQTGNTQLSFDFGENTPQGGTNCRSFCRSYPITLSDRYSQGSADSVVACSATRREPQRATQARGGVEDLWRLVGCFPRSFALTAATERALLDRLQRKAEYWKRPLGDVIACLAGFLRGGRHRPRSPGWFTTVVETRFANLARAAPRMPAARQESCVEYQRDEGTIAEFQEAIQALVLVRRLG